MATANVLSPVQNRSADPKAVRAFAEAAGLVPVGQRGRLPQAARDAFNAEHKGFGSYRKGHFVGPGAIPLRVNDFVYGTVEIVVP